MAQLQTLSRRATWPSGTPAAWSLTTFLDFFQHMPRVFTWVAVANVFTRLLRMASLLIPIKILFLLSAGLSSIPVPFLDVTIPITQMSITLMVVPVGFFPLLAYLVTARVTRMRNRAFDRVFAPSPVDLVGRPKIKQVFIYYSQAISDLLLFAVCAGLMALLLPMITAILLTIVSVAAAVLRYRLKRMQRMGPTDSGFDADEADDPEHRYNQATHIASTTQAIAQAAILPVMVYLVAGELIAGTIEPIWAVAFIFMFRLMMSGMSGALSGIALFLFTMSEETEVRLWLSVYRDLPALPR